MNSPHYRSALLIDDHYIVLLGLKEALKDIFKEVYTATDGKTGLDLTIKKKPDLVILDYHLNRTHGDIVCKQIKEILPKTKVLGFSYDLDATVINQFFIAGINGFMLKSYAEEDIKRAIGQIMSGTDYFCREAKGHLLNRIGMVDHMEHLIVAGVDFSKNELETMRLICQQRSTKEISQTLYLSEKTIELYRSNLIKKTAAKNMAGVIKFALSTGVVKLDQM